MSTLLRRLAGTALMAAAIVMFPVAANATGPVAYSPGHAAAQAGKPLPVDNHADDAAKPTAPRTGAAPRAAAAAASYYYIEYSCRGYENAIRQGGNYWGLVQTANYGTPVGCVSGYITGCGTAYAYGCNWGSGQRITLSTRHPNFALLSAHEFGHNWYGHSNGGCMSWASWYDVMRPYTC